MEKQRIPNIVVGFWAQSGTLEELFILSGINYKVKIVFFFFFFDSPSNLNLWASICSVSKYKVRTLGPNGNTKPNAFKALTMGEAQ